MRPLSRPSIEDAGSRPRRHTQARHAASRARAPHRAHPGGCRRTSRYGQTSQQVPKPSARTYSTLRRVRQPIPNSPTRLPRTTRQCLHVLHVITKSLRRCRPELRQPIPRIRCSTTLGKLRPHNAVDHLASAIHEKSVRTRRLDDDVQIMFALTRKDSTTTSRLCSH